MRVALDTNFLAYAEGVNDSERRNAALDLVGRLPQRDVVVPVQVLGELFHVQVRKARRSAAAARIAVLDWRDPDNVPRPHGAEEAWYVGQGRAPPRNGPFADVRELLLAAPVDAGREDL